MRSMKQEDLMDAMSEIRPEYIEAAAEEPKIIHMKRTKRSVWPGAVAAALVLMIILPNTGAGVARATQGLPVVGAFFQAVTIRNYHYDDGKHSADVDVPEMAMISANESADAVAASDSARDGVSAGYPQATEANASDDVMVAAAAPSEDASADTSDIAVGASNDFGSDTAMNEMQVGSEETALSGASGSPYGSTYDTSTDSASLQEQNLKAAKKSISDITADMQATTDRLISEFKDSLKSEGYGTLDVKTVTMTDTDNWYSICLEAFMSNADSYTERHYYTIDRTTGKQLHLKDLFPTGDYVKVLSEDIKNEMKAREAADSSITYFLDSDMPEDDFKSIDADQEFYIDADENLVISMGQGNVAPMYMGEQTFSFPLKEVQAVIEKDR